MITRLQTERGQRLEEAIIRYGVEVAARGRRLHLVRVCRDDFRELVGSAAESWAKMEVPTGTCRVVVDDDVHPGDFEAYLDREQISWERVCRECRRPL